MKKHISYRHWGGEGETLVFLHYFGGSADSWRWTAEMLQSSYRCIALNLPGFGKTRAMPELSIRNFAQDIHEKLQLLDIDSCTLVGHSMSGKIALQVAADFPEVIQQLILVAPSPPTQEPMPVEERERMLQHPDRKVAATTVKKVTLNTLAEAQFQLAVETQLMIDEATWRWWLLEGMQHSIEAHIHKIQAPVSVIASEDDPAIPYASIQNEVIQVVKGAALITVSNTGHLIPLEDPALMAGQIRQALLLNKEGAVSG